ncbi:MAG: sugar phosphate isomerase/epimerase [Candidatus Latescibacteria bacterium]|nr:sugar phosphate isomerase/epimerase [Candidatus Latescibacterota bacterium]
MARLPIALQLYSVRQDCARDLPGTLSAVAKMGYDGVEFAGYYGFEAATLRTMLDDLGLRVAGAHVSLDTLLGPELDRSVEFHQTLGNRLLIVPGLPEARRSSRAAWLETARLMNGIAERLRPYGMRPGYHNHTVEFQPLEGELPWDTFFGHTDPAVIMQVDIGNALHGGAQVLPFLERYPGRAVTVHLKEYSATNETALIGEGDVPWDEVFRLCEGVGGTEWYIVEQESYASPPLECVERCLHTLRQMGK